MKSDSVTPRWVELARLLLSLTAGAILVIAAFITDSPPVPWARELVLHGLLYFALAFFAFIGTMIFALGEEIADTGARFYLFCFYMVRITVLVGWISFGAGFLTLIEFGKAVIESWPG